MTSPIVCTGDPDGAQHHAPYASVSCVRAKLRWPLSLGSRCRDYVRYVQVFAYSVSSRVQPTYLTTCPYRVCIAVTRLSPPGFSPEVVRSLSTCSNECIHEVSWTILPHLPQSGKEIQDEREQQVSTFRRTSSNTSIDSKRHILWSKHMLFNQQRDEIASLCAAFISSQTPRFTFTVPLHIRQKEAGSQSHRAN